MNSLLIIVVIVPFFIYLLIGGVFIFKGNKEVSQEDREKTHKKRYYYDEKKYSSDRVTLIEKPGDSWDIRAALVANAKETLEISYYTLGAGESLDIFYGLIIKAADSGVKVRIVIDGMFNNTKQKDVHYAFALHPNIEIKFFEKVNLLKPWTFNNRLHDKYIICDSKYMIIGGRNVGDKYFDLKSYNGIVTNDRDVFIYDTLESEIENYKSCLSQTREYFEEIFNSKYAYHPIAGVYTKEEYEKYKTSKKMFEKRKYEMALKGYKRLLNCVKEGLENEVLNEKSLEEWTCRSKPTHGITLSHNKIERMLKEPLVGQSIISVTEQAKKRVIYQSPYTIPPKPLYNSILKVCNQVEATLLTNSMYSSPNFPAYPGYLRIKNSLLKNKMCIYELQSKDSIHSKSIIVDDNMSIVGSFNLESRSMYLSTETMVFIHSEEFTLDLENAIGNYIGSSLKVGSDGGYVPNSNVQEMKVSKLKYIVMKFLSNISWMYDFML